MIQKEQIEETAADVKATIKAIRVALKERTGISWSVTNSRGTAWGWITITCPPARSALGRGFGVMNDQDKAILASAMGFESVHCQGVSIPAGRDFRKVHLARAITGETLGYTAEQYWD